MAIRKSFEEKLQMLGHNLIEMGNLAEQALVKSIQALETQDIELAEQVIKEDEAINDIESAIEELAVRLITAQQPVASDLRKILTTLKMTTSIERIGDLSVDIAKATTRIGNHSSLVLLNEFSTMTHIVQSMIRESLNAYVHCDIEKANETAALDDMVDQLYAQIVHNLLKQMINEPGKLEQLMQLAFIARYVERIADYTTNICEGTIYEMKGIKVDLNR